MRCGGWKTEFMSEVVEETRLAKDCVREDAVDRCCDVVPPLLCPLALDSGLGLESVFSRRRMPFTAYETGYVK